ncbi:rhamnogalacturonan lyase [Aeoliella sp. ICT_H6.2]|uniref:Rhamnogalacturonan lyase n=1 Tax=Aeoliella straminimaris TaxID=2954799 RepID=A0A9X2F9G9_9BACT|nr:rhamnogalacturonan lyase [Aeoliella straminimaris]MCO6044108.1 rhamnogalacturonan lyase [Aeoliella straminimaris]
MPAIRRAVALVAITTCFGCALAKSEPTQAELNRGVVAVRQADGSVFVSWRLLPAEANGVGFNIYRRASSGGPELVHQVQPSEATNWADDRAPADPSLQYSIRTVVGGEERESSSPAHVWSDGYLNIDIDTIEGYRPGDASIGDLDGDGQWEIVLHQASRPRDNGSPGVTGTPILDAYRLDGTRLWRIDLGKNIRDGEHYTQFMVYDLDGDGRAEVACKTADGSVDGTGRVIGDPDKDWRTLEDGSLRNGRILDGPEYLTVFDGRTGAALSTVDYIPSRDPIAGWGGIGGNAGNDNYGNRCDRFLACVAYLDGEHPSLIMCRGVYGRIAIVAWDWRDQVLSHRWTFDTGVSRPPFRNASPYSGMGGHNLSVGDVDHDGRDEIVYQAMVVDDDGTGLYSTGLRHGDAMFISDLDPARPGLEVFTVQENEEHAEEFQTPGAAFRDARTGKILWSHSPAIDVPNGMAADIDPRHWGFEMWGGPGGLRNAQGESIGAAPRETRWSIWWDGDPLRELLSPGRGGWRGRSRRRASTTSPANSNPGSQSDSSSPPGRGRRNDSAERRGPPSWRFEPVPTRISKWNWQTQTTDTIDELEGIAAARGPALMGDLLGDWREEILLVSPQGDSLQLYSTTHPTDLRLPTLLADRQYRLGLVWQNVVYNKPCYPSYYLGADRSEASADPSADTTTGE